MPTGINFLTLAITIVASLFPTIQAKAARGSYRQEEPMFVREIRDNLDNLRHGLNNQQAEIQVLEEKLNNQELIVEAIQDRISESKTSLKSNTANLESKLNTLEETLKSIISDLRQFKTHANESSTHLSTSINKIDELEKVLEHQNKNITHLQTAMQSLMEAFQLKESQESSKRVYKVKNGDSLEKIARHHQTTIKQLKELNDLPNDRIRIGQSLLIPGE